MCVMMRISRCALMPLWATRHPRAVKWGEMMCVNVCSVATPKRSHGHPHEGGRRYAFDAAEGGTTPGRYDLMMHICLYFCLAKLDFLRIDSQRRRLMSKRSSYLSTSFCSDGNVSSKASPFTQSNARKRYCLEYLRTIFEVRYGYRCNDTECATMPLCAAYFFHTDPFLCDMIRRT